MEICYKKNYLDKVIARIDFLKRADHLAESLPKQALDYIKANFPIVESKKLFTDKIELRVDKKSSVEREETDIWVFHGGNKEKTLTISSAFAWVEYKQYSSYNAFKGEFINAIRHLFDGFETQIIGRTGLRYINIFSDIFSSPASTNKYFSKDFIPKIFMTSTDAHVSRCLNLIEYTKESSKARLNYGYYNPDYPAPIRRLSFVVDIDSYCDHPQEISELEKVVDMLHIEAQNIFEGLITEKMRKVLNE